MPQVSSFLQERLQRERKVESERSSSRMSNDPMSASLDLRAIQSSPARSGTSDSRRPRSSGGADLAKKKGLGLKEMEQTLSTLHKQNFDLKLELFHRRERQTALDERVEKLESEKSEVERMNDRLIEELEKRDKAVEEAVAMIVVLEAKVEQLLREREMVRRVDANDYFYSRNDQSTPAPGFSTPTMKSLELPGSDARTIARMPSFLSEHSENTENLRNVYLGVRGSVMSLPRMSEDAGDADRGELNGIRSPSLSVLSESSFLSVYGREGGSSPPSGAANPTTPEVPRDAGLSSHRQSNSKAKIVTPSNTRRPRGASNGSAKFQNINGILDLGGSPLQRLEKLERTLTAMEDASRPTSRDIRPGAHSSPSRGPKPTQHQRTKQEKREALQRVLTNAPMGRDMTHPNNLPPTPDTISTSTLRRYKNSNDTLPKEPDLSNERSYLALSETTASQLSASGERGADLLGVTNTTSQEASMTAFDGRRELPVSNSHYDNRGISDRIQRPRSADETTISHRRARRHSDWDTDDSADDLDGADSMASGMDYWMRESLKPNCANILNPLSSVSQAGNQQDGRVSPDLFSFPSTTNGWATNAMFGSLSGNGYTAAGGGIPSALAQTLDALGESLSSPYFDGLATPVLGGTGIPPPPPNRRSSLHARTGSSSAMASGMIASSPVRQSPGNGKLRKSPERRDRSNSVDVRPSSQGRAQMGFAQTRAPTAPPQNPMPVPDAPQLALQKQRHYPPTASQQPRSRGLNSLFRRSIGSSDQSTAAPSSAPPTQTTFKNAPPPAASTVSPVFGAPSWGRRADLLAADDDRASATPPPIMRNRTLAARGSFDGGAPLEGGAPVGVIPDPVAPPGRPASPAAARADGGGGVRKWLGLGRVSSLRNRAA